MEFTLISNSEQETIELAKYITKYLCCPALITLDGDLGAGKTHFAKGVASFLNVKEAVSSPTFNILKCYFSGRVPFYHIDAYRLEDGLNVDIGLEEVIEGDGITLVEWSCFIKELLYEPLNIRIEVLSSNSRKITLSTEFEKYKSVFEALKEYKNEL